MDLNEHWKRDGIFREPVKKEYDRPSKSQIRKAEVRAEVEKRKILNELKEAHRELWE